MNTNCERCEMLNNDIKSVLNFVSGKTPRQKIVNYIKEYMLNKYTGEAIQKYKNTLRKLSHE